MKSRFKLEKILFIIIVFTSMFLISLESYDHFNRISPTLQDFLSDPSRYEGIKIEKSGKIVEIKDEYFTLESNKIKIKVRSNGQDIKQTKLGTAVIYGKYNKEGYMDLIEIHYSDYNYFKYVISFLSLAIVIFYLLKEWKITKKGFVEKCRTY